MTLEDLRAKYPGIYDAAVNEGITQGVTAERERIREIDAMVLPGMEALANKAKYETGITAGEYAMAMVKAQKEKGVSILGDIKKDAAEVDEIPPAPGDMNDDAAETAELLAHAKKHYGK